MLAAAIGGVGAFVASSLGSGVPEAEAAAGGNLVIGASNASGTSQTVLTSAAGGAAFTLKDTATAGTGIFGWSSAASGAGRGLYGRADSVDGFGIQAKNLAVGAGAGAAIDAIADYLPAIRGSSPIKGVHGISANAGVHGESPSGFGVLGTNTSGTGVRGTSVSGFAVYGTSTTSDAIFGNSNSGAGVRAISDSYYGVHASGAVGGVYASSPAGISVYATSTNGTAVFGTSNNGWSLYGGIDARVENDFQVGGNASVAGSLSKGGGSFRIDHPLDPANKYLSHSFVESPDMLNVYNGLETLDARGEATIVMPAWFEALNRDFRYQLTPHGSFSPLFVKSEMDRGRFKVAGGAPNQRMSWQVTGVRRDAWANANRIKVEEAKTGSERGTYLHPEAHGQPASKRGPAKHPIPNPNPNPAEPMAPMS